MKEVKINELAKDGFSLHNHKKQELDIALISLKIGFEAFYSTYQSVKRYLSIVETRPSQDDFDLDDTEMLIERLHISNYVKAYVETIFHFHHFIEVSIKEILRQAHPLLASTADRKHIILDKLLKKEEVTQTELEELYSLEYRYATERLYELIKERRIANHENMNFIISNKELLDQINKLRNRLVHRGTFVLRYPALDVLVGKHIFPFILKLLDLPIYKSNKFQWQSKLLHCQIDPIQKIIYECKVSKPNFSNLAFLKEMGRAAYKNPLMPKQKMVNDRRKEVIEERAKKELGIDNNAVDVIECPVCGANTLVRYWDWSPNDETQEIFLLSCICCSFEINSELNKVSFKGFNIKPLWQWDENL